MDARCKLQVSRRLRTKPTSYKLQATSHRPQATSHGPLFYLPPPGEVAVSRRGVAGWEIGSGMWEVGRLLSRTCWTTPCAVSTGHEPQATSRCLNPHPGPSLRRGRSASRPPNRGASDAARAPGSSPGKARRVRAKGTRLAGDANGLSFFRDQSRVPGRAATGERDPGVCPELDSGSMPQAKPRFRCR